MIGVILVTALFAGLIGFGVGWECGARERDRFHAKERESEIEHNSARKDWP